jgi:hypothetical protein
MNTTIMTTGYAPVKSREINRMVSNSADSLTPDGRRTLSGSEADTARLRDIDRP